MRKDDWVQSPLTAELLVLTDIDEETGFDPFNEDCPAQAAALGMCPFLEYATFEAILCVQYDQASSSTVREYIEAVNHYREHDSFLNRAS